MASLSPRTPDPGTLGASHGSGWQGPSEWGFRQSTDGPRRVVVSGGRAGDGGRRLAAISPGDAARPPRMAAAPFLAGPRLGRPGRARRPVGSVSRTGVEASPG